MVRGDTSRRRASSAVLTNGSGFATETPYDEVRRSCAVLSLIFTDTRYCRTMADFERVFAVHTVKPDGGAGAVEVIFETEREARWYARSRSNDWRILSASVTSYVLGELGTRCPVVWFKDGDEMHPRAPRPDGRYYPTDHPVADPTP